MRKILLATISILALDQAIHGGITGEKVKVTVPKAQTIPELVTTLPITWPDDMHQKLLQSVLGGMLQQNRAGYVALVNSLVKDFDNKSFGKIAPYSYYQCLLLAVYFGDPENAQRFFNSVPAANRTSPQQLSAALGLVLVNGKEPNSARVIRSDSEEAKKGRN